MRMVTATEMKNSFGKYLDMVINGEEIAVTKNGKEVARFTPKAESVSYLSDSLRGVLKKRYDADEERKKALKEKYAAAD